MFIGGDVERHQKLSAFTNNLTAFLGLLILGFPVTPATVRSTLVGCSLVVAAAMQVIVRRSRSQARLAPIRTILEQVNDLSHHAS